MATETSNPYSPPDDSLAAPHRTSALAASVLVFVLFLVLSVRAFRATIYLALMSPWDVVRDAATWLSPDTLGDALGVSWAVTRPFLVFAIASFCFWVYRANRDARELGASRMSFSPAWAVAVGFVPVVNLIGPYRAVKEIYQASSRTDPAVSANHAVWRAEPVPIVLPMWWGFWISSLAWNLVPYTTLTASSAVWGQAILEVLRALAALLLMIVVRSIERRQAALEFTQG